MKISVTLRALAPYTVVGIFLGVVLVKSQVIYWSRIHEMFRFESFHMYGVLGSALMTAFVSLRVIARKMGMVASGSTTKNKAEKATRPKAI